MRLAAKRRLLRILYVLTVFTLAAVLWHTRGNVVVERFEAKKTALISDHVGGSSYLRMEDMIPILSSTGKLEDAKTHRQSRTEDSDSDEQRCTMATCFDVGRCLDDFKVFVYPAERSEKPSTMYKKFLTAIRESSYFTSNPEEACLLILNLDTLDRDPLSSEFVRHLPEKIKKLPHWNNGRNHLIFNFFSGSYPDYSEELDFPYGEAILAKSSFSSRWYRAGFDISLPLLSKKHKEKGKQLGDMTVRRNLYPIHRHYLLTFKGKRYLWGHGSETRNSLHHLHNGKDVIMLTTCKHGKHWDRFMDKRCAQDNSLYDRYDFSELIMNSTFCLVPRGRRLGSFRFLESLQAGCIPVSLSNGFVLPFGEVIDWRKAALIFDERQLLQLPYLLRNLPDEEIFSRRIHSQFLWEEYFSSVQKVVMTSLEIIRARIQRTHGQFIWNRYPGALSVNNLYSKDLADFPFYYNGFSSQSQNYSAVVLATRPAPKGDSPLVLLLKKLCNSAHTNKVIVLWTGHTLPKIMLPTHCSAPVIIEDKRGNKPVFAGVPGEVTTDAVLLLWEDVDLVPDEVEFGYSTWLSFPDRLVGFSSLRHFWDPANRHWKVSFAPNNQYSLVSIGAAFVHRYYIDYFVTQSPTFIHKIADSSLGCLDVALNVIISDITGKPPLKITHRTSLKTQSDLFTKSNNEENGSEQAPKNSLRKILKNRQDPQQSKKILSSKEKQDGSVYSSCLDLLAGVYGHLPLRYSVSRADPVLFGDDISVLRKEFRRIESRL